MKRGKDKIILEHSAGGALIRPKQAKRFEVCLILVRSRRGHLRWQLPKGHIEKSELAKEAASREIFEETGCHGRLIRELGTCEFFYTRRSFDGSLQRIKKRVDFFLLFYQKGSVSDHDAEVEQARFISLAEAIRLLAFESEKDIVRRARDFLSTQKTMLPGEEP